MRLLKAEQQKHALFEYHEPGCDGSFRRLYQRKVEVQGQRPRLTEVGYYCDVCLVVVLD